MKDASFLEPFLIDPEVLSWSPGSKASDLAKKTINVLRIIKEDPAALRNNDVKTLVYDKDSQIIKDKDGYYSHIYNTAEIYKQLVEKLYSKCPHLDLPDLETARALGLIHDLSKIYAKCDGNFKQHDHELTLYFHSEHLGLEIIANNVAMHSAYFEILKMIKEGSGFSGVDLYKNWTSALNNQKSPLSFDKIESYFHDFLSGNDNLPLIGLTVADYIENGKSNFSLDSFEKDFESRSKGIINRYYLDKVLNDKEPSALGVALMKRGGLERNLIYKNIILDLLNGRTNTIHKNFVKRK